MKHRAILTLACLLVACSPARLVAPLRYATPAGAAPDDPFRARPPSTVPVVEPREAVRETTLPNGLRVVLVERHDFPIVAAQLLVDRGALDVDDPSGIRIAETMYMFARGGDQANRDALAAQSAKTGAVWSTGRYDDSCWVSVRAPSDAFDASLEILARSTLHPRLAVGEYDRRAGELAQAAAWKGTSLHAVEREILFGRDHAYGGRLLKRVPISQEDAQALHDLLFQPTHATLVVVGDVTPAQVDSSAARWLGAWNATRTLPRKTAPPPPRNGPRVALLNRSEMAQRPGGVFARGPLATSEDFEAFELVARLLGGAKSSPIFEQLREGSGAAYSIDAPVTTDRTATWMTIDASYDSDKAVDGARDVLRAIEAVRDGRITDEELTVARETLVSQWRGAMATVDGSAASYARAIALGMEPNRLQEFPARIARLQREDVVRVAKTYLDAKALHVVFVGDERWFNAGSLGMGGATTIELAE